MSYRLVIIFILGLLLNCFHTANSQVTIGANLNPEKGAFLDVKEKNNDSGGENATKGILFPRVKLTDLNKLTPMLDGVDLNDPTQRLKHKGLVVYNTNTASPFSEGLYYWDSNQWVLTSGSPLNKVGTNNPAILNTDDVYLTGGLSLGKSTLSANSKLDVTGNANFNGVVTVNSTANNATIADAFIPPRLTGDELKAKDNHYTADFDGATVYITAPVSTSSPKTQLIKESGLYYFSSTDDKWYPLNPPRNLGAKIFGIISRTGGATQVRQSQTLIWNQKVGLNMDKIRFGAGGQEMIFPPFTTFKITGMIGIASNSASGYITSRFEALNGTISIATRGYTESSTETYNDGGVTNPIAIFNVGKDPLRVRLIASCPSNNRLTYITGDPQNNSLGTYILVEQLY